MLDTGSLTPHVAAWMAQLAGQRPVFHSEFDFQLALSLVMDSVGVERIRLERLVRLDGQPRFEIDIMAHLNGVPIALELKYPKERFVGTVGADGYDEAYDLPASGAFDIDARGVWKDASRIEMLISAGLVRAGAAVVLSNYPFWNNSLHREGTQAHDFRLWAGRDDVTSGSVLRFGEATKWATAEHAPVELNSDYRCEWRPYSVPDGTGKTEFKYMVLEPSSSAL